MPDFEVTHHLLGLYSTDQNVDTRPFPILQESGSYRPAMCSGRRRKHVYGQGVAVLAEFQFSGHQISGSCFLLHKEDLHPSPRETAQTCTLWPLCPATSAGSLNERKSSSDPNVAPCSPLKYKSVYHLTIDIQQIMTKMKYERHIAVPCP